MEIAIKNKIHRINNNEYQYLSSLVKDIEKYVSQFTYDKKIYDYTHACFVFSAYPILQRFYPHHVRNFIAFIEKVCDYTILDFQNASDIDSINNFQSHRLRLVSTAGLVIKSDKYINWTVTEIEKFIRGNLREDGTCLDFHLRDSITYVTYTLEPLVETCLNLVKYGRPNYYFYTDKDIKCSIAKSVRWLIPYIKGDARNVMFKNSVYESDKKKNEYMKIWTKTNALNLINLSINFDRSLIGLYTE